MRAFRQNKTPAISFSDSAFGKISMHLECQTARITLDSLQTDRTLSAELPSTYLERHLPHRRDS